VAPLSHSQWKLPLFTNSHMEDSETNGGTQAIACVFMLSEWPHATDSPWNWLWMLSLLADYWHGNAQ